MTVEATSFSLPHARSGSLEGESPLAYGIAFWLALIQVSIAASQIVLAVLVLLWLARVFKKELALVSLPFDRPILLYAGLSLASGIFSLDPGASLMASKKLLLLVVPYLLVSTLRRRESLESLVLVLIVMADVSALVGLWQYHFGELGDINHRIRGFMSHYMTYSGLLMGVGVLAIAELLFRGRRRPFLLASLAVILVALVLTLTRSAWVGMLAASAVLLFMKDRRLLLLVPAVAIVVPLLLPGEVERRVASFIKPDTSGMDRLYMLRAGSRMVANHPWLGVGPEMVPEVYPIYRVPEAPHRENLHLHNNLIQIAAERGLPCLAAWMWLVGVSLAASLASFRRARTDPEARALASGALGVIAAGFAAGLFEYNFGDSEFQMLFLFAAAIPLVLDRRREPSS